MEAVLPVSKVAFDAAAAESGDVSNMTAEQYMSWVRAQAEGLPSVVRVDLEASKHVEQSKYMPEIQDICPCPAHMQPADNWVYDVIYGFSELRGIISTLAETPLNKARAVAVPPMKDTQAWKLFCFGEEDGFAGESVKEGHGDSNIPAQEVLAIAATQGNPRGPLGSSSGSSSSSSSGSSSGTSVIAAAALRESKQRLLAALDGDMVSEERDSNAMEMDEHSHEPNASSSSSADEEVRPDSDGNDTVNGCANADSSSASFAKWEGAKCHQPTTAILLQFDQVLTQRLLTLHCSWLQDSNIDEVRGQWIYGLLARLEKPLYQDAAAIVRSLYRRCCELRACVDEDGDTFDTDIAALNVLISITGTYFRQADSIGDLDPLFEALLLDDGGSSSDSDSDSDGAM